MDTEKGLEAIYGRPPTVKEIALAAGVKPATVVSVRARTAPHTPLTFDVATETDSDYGELYEALDKLDSRSYDLLCAEYGLLGTPLTVGYLAALWEWDETRLEWELEDARARLRAAMGITGPEAMTLGEVLAA